MITDRSDIHTNVCYYNCYETSSTTGTYNTHNSFDYYECREIGFKEDYFKHLEFKDFFSPDHDTRTFGMIRVEKIKEFKKFKYISRKYWVKRIYYHKTSLSSKSGFKGLKRRKKEGRL